VPTKKELRDNPEFDSDYVTSFRTKYGLWQALKLKCLVERRSLSDEMEALIREFVDPEYLALARRQALAVAGPVAASAEKKGKN
jgi:hypothetical protein